MKRSRAPIAFHLALAMTFLLSGRVQAGCHDRLIIMNNLYSPKTGALSIQSDLCLAGPYQVKVFNSAGEEIRVLKDVKNQPAGVDVATWDGKNEAGDDLASGIYIIILRTDSGTMKAKVAVVR